MEMRKLEIEVARTVALVKAHSGYTICHKAAVALVMVHYGRGDLGAHMARRIAVKHGATGAYRLARQLEAMELV